jgi:Serine/Threonine/Tyrosine Kinase found in polyvalent proteins
MITRYEIQNVISGTSESPASTVIEAAARELRRRKKASKHTTYKEQQKEQEEPGLISWIAQENLWVRDVDESRYLTRGAEQLVYLDFDTRFVLKLNDGIFYASWLDYLHSLLLHNLFFPCTAYELIGFYRPNETLFAVVKQPFISTSEITDLNQVYKFLTGNGFRNTRHHDYVNDELGLLLEDMHDENVLTSDETLFFIDTVFYILPEAYI